MCGDSWRAENECLGVVLRGVCGCAVDWEGLSKIFDRCHKEIKSNVPRQTERHLQLVAGISTTTVARNQRLVLHSSFCVCPCIVLCSLGLSCRVESDRVGCAIWCCVVHCRLKKFSTSSIVGPFIPTTLPVLSCRSPFHPPHCIPVDPQLDALYLGSDSHRP